MPCDAKPIPYTEDSTGSLTIVTKDGRVVRAKADILRSEIVRCNDCKWRRICTENNIRAEDVQDDDYCSWGERKEATT